MDPVFFVFFVCLLVALGERASGLLRIQGGAWKREHFLYVEGEKTARFLNLLVTRS